MNWDLRVSDAKSHVTTMLCRTVEDPRLIHDLAGAIDNLNKAWDELTDALVRQREERDRVIRRLIDELAERKEAR